MDKLLARFSGLFRGVKKNLSHATPSYAWSVILWTFVVLTLISAYLAHKNYLWVTAQEAVVVKPDKTISISGEEITHVVKVYQAKKTEYFRLKSGGPLDVPIITGNRSGVSQP